jgi:ATP-dependent DNA helicase RecG
VENTTGTITDGIIERDTIKDTEVTEKDIRVTEKKIGVTEKGIKDTKKLTLIQEALLIEISKNKFVTIHELSKKTKINIRNTKENISKLKSKGLLIRIGSNKGGYWKVIK